VVLSVLALVALGSLAVGPLWPLTPNVGDAEGRIATRLAGDFYDGRVFDDDKDGGPSAQSIGYGDLMRRARRPWTCCPTASSPGASRTAGNGGVRRTPPRG